MAQPPGMEWQSYFDNFRSVRDIITGKESPSTAGIILGNAIDAMAGGPTDMGKSFGAGQPMFGASSSAPQGSVPAPTVAPTVTSGVPALPPVGGQQPNPMITQPQYSTNIQQQPVTQTPSYSRFLFSPQ